MMETGQKKAKRVMKKQEMDAGLFRASFSSDPPQCGLRNELIHLQGMLQIVLNLSSCLGEKFLQLGFPESTLNHLPALTLVKWLQRAKKPPGNRFASWTGFVTLKANLSP